MVEDKTVIAEAGSYSYAQVTTAKKACLIQYSGASLGKRYVLNHDSIIGRVPPVDLIINEPTVSKKHARFSFVGSKVSVEDLQSSNGTYVNDIKINARTELNDGDIIRVGNVLLKFFANDNADNIFMDKIYRMATIDAGTQIFNKKYLLESLDAEFKFAKVYQKPLSLIMYDLDFFKKVNDVYGHNAGDFILKETASLVKGAIRKEDIFGRFGGEEFCIVLPNTELKIAVELAERLRSIIEAHVFNFESNTIKQTVSIGVCQQNSHHESVPQFMEDVDKKLYDSKHNGRNRVSY